MITSLLTANHPNGLVNLWNPAAESDKLADFKVDLLVFLSTLPISWSLSCHQNNHIFLWVKTNAVKVLPPYWRQLVVTWLKEALLHFSQRLWFYLHPQRRKDSKSRDPADQHMFICVKRLIKGQLMTLWRKWHVSRLCLQIEVNQKRAVVKL